MASVDQIQCQHEGDKSCRFNIVVVPGTSGTNLAARTCPHFRDWLDRIVEARPGQPQLWVYNHHIKLQDIKSWDAFPASGDELLSHLLSMLRDGRLSPKDNLILIGHKLGCYILKKALTQAFSKEHRPEEEQLLNIVDTIVMVGEPDLQPTNESQWLQLISECVPGGRPLLSHLANDRTIGSLEVITSDFEAACFYCTHFEIRSDSKPSTRSKWKFGHKKNVGCVERATVLVRISTTASAEHLLEVAEGGLEKMCGLHPKSGHYRNLLLTAGQERSDQSLRIAIDTEEPHERDTSLSTPPVDETIIALIQIDEAQGDQWQVGDGLSSGPDQLNTGDIGDQVGQELAPAVLDEESICHGDLPERPLDEVPVIVPAISFSRQTPLLVTDTIHNDVLAGIDTTVINTEPNIGATRTPKRRKRRLPLSSILPPKCQQFIGRAAELDEISHYLLGSRASQPGTSIKANYLRIICISGMGGTGKTQVALEYCSRSLAQYDTVLWVNASTRSNLGRSFHDCAMLQGLVDGRSDQNHSRSRDRLLSWCASSSKQWLLVIDDLDECFESELSSFIPQKGFGSVIITCRRELAAQDTMQHIEHVKVPMFSVAEAMALLRTQLHEGADPVHRNAVARAAHRYYASPFALKHVIEWSQRERLSIRNIDDLLTGRGRDLSLRFGHDSVNTYFAVTTPRLSNTCGSMLETMAFLDTDRIPHQLLLASQLHNADRAAEDIVHDSIEELWRFALCDVDRSGSFSYIHRCAADWILDSMTDESWDDALVRASRSLQRQWPQNRKLRNIIDGFWPEFPLLHSHLQHTANACLRVHGGRRRLIDADDSLKTLLLTHSWLNARHGNSGEDQELMHLTHALISRPNVSAGEVLRDTLMPLRCVYIGSGNANATVSVVDTEGKREPYLALSYSWDSETGDHALTKATLTKFRKALPMSHLSTVIRDAIAVGRGLGFQYLWIDRYCMVQDDTIECSDELLKLTSYYKNAALTMSALAAPSLMPTFRRWGCKVVSCEPYSIWSSGSAEDERWTYQSAFLLEVGILRDGNYPSPILTMSNVPTISVDSLFASSKAKPGTLDNKINEVAVRRSGTNMTSKVDEIEEANQVKNIQQARKSLQIGRTHLCERSFLRASATLTFSRDLLAPLISRTAEALDIYTMATAILGACYHLLDLEDVAGDILTLLHEQYYSQLSDGHYLQSYSYARLRSALGVNNLRRGRNKAAQECLRSAGSFVPVSDIEEEKLFLICVDISLSDTFKAEGDTKEARRLLDGALEQLMDLPESQTVDAHTCRALHRRSLLDEMEGNRRRHRASLAGAVAAFEQLQLDGFQAASKVSQGTALTQADFDTLVEPWFA